MCSMHKNRGAETKQLDDGIGDTLVLALFGSLEWPCSWLLCEQLQFAELPLQELIELAKRVQIPGYEAAYELVHDAVSEGVIAPCISSGFYLQCEIWDVLKWAKCRTSANTSHVEHQNRCVVSH
jgi:hypothetical protein